MCLHRVRQNQKKELYPIYLFGAAQKNLRFGEKRNGLSFHVLIFRILFNDDGNRPAVMKSVHDPGRGETCRSGVEEGPAVTTGRTPSVGKSYPVSQRRPFRSSCLVLSTVYFYNVNHWVS